MRDKTKNILITGCVLSGLAVGIGAFGAHGLKDLLTANGKTGVFETAVKYHFYHGLAILIAGLISVHFQARQVFLSAYLMLAGVLIFSFSLYVLAITNIGVLGAITPIGGLLLIAGWIFLIIGIKKGI